jgi:4-amino-4-deoxy-L-arabinose transferase-like glycosyltransferase
MGRTPAEGTTTHPRSALLRRAFARPALRHGAVLLGIFALAIPLLFLSQPSHLTSDESLYLAEGFNIAQGKGITYPSGEPVNHRPPLYPALLAGSLKASDGSLESAYWVPKVFALFSLLLVYLLGRKLFGTVAGILAALMAGCGSLLNSLATTLYLDGTETSFMLLSLLLLLYAFDHRRALLFATAGGALGLAFLVKEAAILWVPIPLLLYLFVREYQVRRNLLGIALFEAAFVALAGWWWVWVYAHTGRIYLLGEPSPEVLAGLTPLALTGFGIAILGAASFLALRALRPLLSKTLQPVARSLHPSPAASPSMRSVSVGLIILIGWCVLSFMGLERSWWPVEGNYFRLLLDYVWTVGRSVQPFFLILAAWAFIVWRSFGRPADRTLLLALLLFGPFALLTATRSLHIRDLLPLVCLSYVATGALLAWPASAATQLARQSEARQAVAYTGLAMVAALLLWVAYDEETSFLEQNRSIDQQERVQTNWNNPLVASTAEWMVHHVPPGTQVMSSRLYHSQLHVLTEGQYPIRQLPTVRIAIDPSRDQPLQRTSTLFRWEDHRLGPDRDYERWLYLQRYPIKGYYIALSEIDLIRDLRRSQADYLVLSGEDAGFSTFSYLDYFTQNPAFTLLHQEAPDSLNAVYIFRVHRRSLEYQDRPLTMSGTTLSALVERLEDSDGGVPSEQALRIIAPHGIRVAPGDGITQQARALLQRVYAGTPTQ